MDGAWGERNYNSYVFLTLALEGGQHRVRSVNWFANTLQNVLQNRVYGVFKQDGSNSCGPGNVTRQADSRRTKLFFMDCIWIFRCRKTHVF
jgi:hypothetical protein